LKRQAAEWQVIGDQRLLSLQRRVHQHVRFQSSQPLRLDAQHWSGPQLLTPAPTGWILGNLNFLEYQRPEQLLRERIIDAWLASYADTPIRIRILPPFASAGCPCISSFQPSIPYWSSVMP
jgi:hypothetical protein